LTVSTLEMFGFTVVWLALLTLAALLFLLYRLVERAYEFHGSGAATGLLAGVRVPDIEILSADDLERPLRFPSHEDIWLLAFVTTECDACRRLIRTLDGMRDSQTEAIALVNGEATSDFPRGGNPRLKVLWLSHPADATRGYGVTSVPFVYALRGRTVLASTTAATAAEVEALLRQAEERESLSTEAQERLVEAR